VWLPDLIDDPNSSILDYLFGNQQIRLDIGGFSCLSHEKPSACANVHLSGENTLLQATNWCVLFLIGFLGAFLVEVLITNWRK
jgi:hypothetical protein